MIAVIFEVWPKPEHKQEYLDLAAELRPILETIDGFISIERFESLTEKGKILSLSFFRDEDALAAWRNVPLHRKDQAKGRAKALQHLGFKAIASTSAGFAWSIGKADNRVTLDEVCEHLTALCTAVDLPVNADFEGGFAHKPEKVAANVARAVKTGVAGLSIEDS